MYTNHCLITKRSILNSKLITKTVLTVYALQTYRYTKNKTRFIEKRCFYLTPQTITLNYSNILCLYLILSPPLEYSFFVLCRFEYHKQCNHISLYAMYNCMCINYTLTQSNTKCLEPVVNNFVFLFIFFLLSSRLYKPPKPINTINMRVHIPSSTISVSFY